MSEPSVEIDARPQPDEIILAQFVTDLDRDGDAVLADYARRYPPLAQEFNSLAAMQRLLGAPTNNEDSGMPRRLGEFFILRRIASGGMGEIYEAVQQKLNRRVAVKTIRQGRVDPRTRERFLREQRVLAKLHHTHIVPIHTAGEEGALQYFAMPFIEGAALHRVVRLLGQMRETESSGGTPSLVKLAGMVAGDAAAGAAPWRALATTCDVPAAARVAAPPPAAPEAAKPSTDSPAQCDAGRAADSMPTLRPKRRRLSLEYFRAVAAVMADAAEALQQAHDVHVLHRDMKPSNIMVDAHGQCWLIDFGLAGYLNFGRDMAAGEAEAGAAGETAASGFVGTLSYMAPEQLRGRADVRTDVWGLGATLYELLTLQKAFSGAESTIAAQIANTDPTPPRRVIANVPHDLAAICRQALRKSPDHRYQTARQFADDLRRWLRREPTVARPARPLRRALLWSRRNKGWAGVIAVSVLSVAALLVASRIYISNLTRRDSVLAQRGILLQRQLVIRVKERSAGWSEDAWNLVAEANQVLRTEDHREPAAAALVGLDAKLARHRKEIGVSAAAWSADGKRLLLGGGSDGRGKPSHEARIWDSRTDTDKMSGLPGEGPVAWRRDGTALEAIVKDARTVLLWDVGSQRALREIVVPAVDPVAPADEADEPLVALARDGSTVAVARHGGMAALGRGGGTVALGRDDDPAATTSAEQTANILAWDTLTGDVILRVEFAATAIAVSPHGKLLAAGNDDGQIRVWAMGRAEPVATLSADRSPIESLAFGQDLWTGPNLGPADVEEGPLLLAASGAGGQVTIWDLAARQPRSFCRGTLWDANHIAFSPDSATLATGGRQKVHLWDVATGRSLLELAADDTVVGLDFSPDGRRLAVSAHNGNGDPAGLFVYEILESRGLQLLRGLRAPVIQVRFSRDGQHLAALSNDWQLAVWNTATGQLRRVLPAPKGITADNAGFAISPDAQQIAFGTSGAAVLWDIATGQELRRWKLNPGLQDQLAFHYSSGKLLLVRAEAKSALALDRRDRESDPLVCRIYELLADDRDRAQRIAEVSGFDRRVNALVLSPYGECFVVDGYEGPGDTGRHVAAFDGLTGQRLWPLDSRHNNPHSAALCVDPLGTTVSVALDDTVPYCELFDARTGDQRGRLPDNSGMAIGPGGRLSIGGKNDYGHVLYRLGHNAPLLRLGIDSLTSSYVPSFNWAGTHVAWGNADGTVTLCDLALLRRRLAELGLDWSD